MTDNFWEGFIKEAKIYSSMAQAVASKPSLKSYKLLGSKEFKDSIAAKRSALHLKRLQEGKVKPEVKSFAQKSLASKPQTGFSPSFEQKAKRMNPSSLYRKEGIGTDIK